MQSPIIIYLSPAVHAADRSCACGGCSENAHVRRYLDELAQFLTASGFAVRRNGDDLSGAAGVRRAVAQSNECGAALHYTVHTADSDGRRRGSVLLCSAADVAWAGRVAHYRRQVYDGEVTVCPCEEMYEIAYTAAPCVYDYLVFHDNPADAHFLHTHMRQLAAATAQAFCEIFGQAFCTPHEKDRTSA